MMLVDPLDLHSSFKSDTEDSSKKGDKKEQLSSEEGPASTALDKLNAIQSRITDKRRNKKASKVLPLITEEPGINSSREPVSSLTVPKERKTGELLE